MKFASRLLIVGVAFAVMFAIGCSSAEPTATPIPPTATAVPQPTATAVPTEAPAAETSSSVAPTATAIAAATSTAVAEATVEAEAAMAAEETVTAEETATAEMKEAEAADEEEFDTRRGGSLQIVGFRPDHVGSGFDDGQYFVRHRDRSVRRVNAFDRQSKRTCGARFGGKLHS